MEILAKTLIKRNDVSCIKVKVPEHMLEYLNLEHKDRVRVKSTGTGFFYLEKSPNNEGTFMRKDGNITFPPRLRDRYRITHEHKAAFFIHKGKVCFKFTRD